jgi:hypothetical protein
MLSHLLVNFLVPALALAAGQAPAGHEYIPPGPNDGMWRTVH